MPSAPPRVCARCAQPAPKGQPCACRPTWENSTHPSSNDRHWQKIRANQLRTHPICQWINVDGTRCRRPATVPDHIVPLADGGDRYDPANLQSLCDPHHSIKTTADAQRGRKRQR